jgi:hypothetical protein
MATTSERKAAQARLTGRSFALSSPPETEWSFSLEAQRRLTPDALAKLQEDFQNAVIANDRPLPLKRYLRGHDDPWVHWRPLETSPVEKEHGKAIST